MLGRMSDVQYIAGSSYVDIDRVSNRGVESYGRRDVENSVDFVNEDISFGFANS